MKKKLKNPLSIKDVINSLPGTTKHAVIPDCQVRPGTPINHLEWAGNYLAEKHPEYIHNMGDFNDMASLNSHGSKLELEGSRYKDDIEYGKEAMNTFLTPILKEQQWLKKRGIEWNFKHNLYLGNHEYRIKRCINDDPKLKKTIDLEDLSYRKFNISTYDFLEVVNFCGIQFSHYFTSGIRGLPVTSARLMLQKKHLSCIMGHVQRREVHYERKGDGTGITGIFSGIFNQHEEEYLTPQGNRVDRGIWLLYNVKNGEFNEQYIPINYLKYRYS